MFFQQCDKLDRWSNIHNSNPYLITKTCQIDGHRWNKFGISKTKGIQGEDWDKMTIGECRNLRS